MPLRDLPAFINATFPSVWSLELLLQLRSGQGRSWSAAELVASLRASDLIVERSLEALIAAGLIIIDHDGCARYHPASAELDTAVGAVAALYARTPDAVRRAIIAPRGSGLAAFADAFRLRKD